MQTQVGYMNTNEDALVMGLQQKAKLQVLMHHLICFTGFEE